MAKVQEVAADVRFEYHGSLWLVRPLTDAAREWLEYNVSSESQWFGGALACESRFVESLRDGMLSEGFTVDFLGRVQS